MGRPTDRGMVAKDKLLAATGELLQEQGYSSTGLAQILEASGAAKGSLYFYFPGGKEELVAAALARSSDALTQLFEAVLSASPTPALAIQGVVAFFKGQLEQSTFTKGCPIATVALEQAATSDVLQEVCAAAFQRWHDLIEQRLVRDGFSLARAPSLANLLLTTLEGALLVSRARRSTSPLEQAGSEMIRILEQKDDK